MQFDCTSKENTFTQKSTTAHAKGETRSFNRRDDLFYIDLWSRSLPQIDLHRGELTVIMDRLGSFLLPLKQRFQKISCSKDSVPLADIIRKECITKSLLTNV